MYGINYVNILRHLNAKAKRVMNSYNKCHIQNDAVDELALHIFSDVDYRCECCFCEDFGYCDLRNSRMNARYRNLKFCIPAFIKWSDKELKEVIHGKPSNNRIISK